MALSVSERKTQGGYSVIELAVALGLFGILWAMGAPSIPLLLSSYDLSNTTQQVMSDLRRARARAITTNAQARLQFGSGAYVIERESPRGSGSYVVEGGKVSLPATVHVSAAPVDPTFNSRGLLTVPTTITVRGAYGKTKTLTVSAIGRVTIN